MPRRVNCDQAVVEEEVEVTTVLLVDTLRIVEGHYLVHATKRELARAEINWGTHWRNSSVGVRRLRKSLSLFTGHRCGFNLAMLTTMVKYLRGASREDNQQGGHF